MKKSYFSINLILQVLLFVCDCVWLFDLFGVLMFVILFIPNKSNKIESTPENSFPQKFKNFNVGANFSKSEGMVWILLNDKSMEVQGSLSHQLWPCEKLSSINRNVWGGTELKSPVLFVYVCLFICLFVCLFMIVYVCFLRFDKLQTPLLWASSNAFMRDIELLFGSILFSF